MKYNSIKITPILLYLIALGLNSCQEELEHDLPVIKVRYYADHLGLGDYSDAEIKLYDAKGDLGFDGEMKIKYRGNSNFQYSKKSFTLKFKKALSMVSMDRSVYWKLNAEYIDKTFMRNKLSYDLFRQFRKGNFAPEVDFTVLYENEKYQGIYTISEGVNEYRLGLNLDDPNAVLFKEPPFHFAPSKHKKNYDNFAHYSKVDERYAYFSQKAKKKLIKQSYYNQRYPDIFEDNKKSIIHNVTEFLFNSSDADFTEKVFQDYFDQDNILDWHLLLLITNNGDGIIKNNYFYRTASNEPLMYCPWDFDHSFGREGDGALITEDICPIENHILFQRLLELNPQDYKKKLYEKFEALKAAGVISVEQLHKMIDDNAKIIRPEIKQNEKRWPMGEIVHFKGSNFEKELKLMKEWIEKRIPRIERYLEDLQKAEVNSTPIPPPPPIELYSPGIGSTVEIPDYDEIYIEVPPDYIDEN